LNRELNIRNLYTPIQPTVSQLSKDVSYSEVYPDQLLQNYIYCYWTLKSNAPLINPFNYLVVADGCIDIFIDASSPIDSYIMGFCNKYTQFLLENSFHYIGIRFLPSIFPAMFNVDAMELSNQVEYLELVVPKLASFVSAVLSQEEQVANIDEHLNRFFIHHLNSISLRHDGRLNMAVNLILKDPGMVNLEKSLDVGISSRQLRRLFQYYIGDCPKMFSQVIRFQKELSTITSSNRRPVNNPELNMNYYDQAHHIKTFKNFYGLTPGKVPPK
jgi:AraC-like DNA-binding protein